MALPLLQSAGLSSRYRLGALLNQRGLLGEAVEIGTHRGRFARALLTVWQGERLYCVDPWTSGYDPNDPASHGNRQADYRAAVRRLNKFGKRSVILHETSLRAIKRFRDGQLCFIYVDGCHQRQSVIDDLYGWWPKLRRGGILAGHDFVCPSEKERIGWGCNIQPVVFMLAETYSVPILWLIPEQRNSNWSYFLVKP